MTRFLKQTRTQNQPQRGPRFGLFTQCTHTG
jgi:hypothetical protein